MKDVLTVFKYGVGIIILLFILLYPDIIGQLVGGWYIQYLLGLGDGMGYF